MTLCLRCALRGFIAPLLMVAGTAVWSHPYHWECATCHLWTKVH